MTETENNGETTHEYNPRFLQYARWRGMIPEEVMAADLEEFPGGKMAGFILWNDEQVSSWCQETGTDRHWASLFFEEISAWIDRRLDEREAMSTHDTRCCSTHCCKDHGCKYGYSDCPVVAGVEKQVYPCESCREENSFKERIAAILRQYDLVDSTVEQMSHEIMIEARKGFTLY